MTKQISETSPSDRLIKELQRTSQTAITAMMRAIPNDVARAVFDEGMAAAALSLTQESLASAQFLVDSSASFRATLADTAAFAIADLQIPGFDATAASTALLGSFVQEAAAAHQSLLANIIPASGTFALANDVAAHAAVFALAKIQPPGIELDVLTSFSGQTIASLLGTAGSPIPVGRPAFYERSLPPARSARATWSPTPFPKPQPTSKAPPRVVDFGEHNQFGDVRLRDVVFGNQVILNIQMHTGPIDAELCLIETSGTCIVLATGKIFCQFIPPQPLGLLMPSWIEAFQHQLHPDLLHLPLRVVDYEWESRAGALMLRIKVCCHA